MLGYYGFMPAPVMTPEATRTLANAQSQNTADGLIEPARGLNEPHPPAQVPVPKLETVDRGKLLVAALRAKRTHPGPIGELLSSHLTSYSEFGWRFGGDSSIARLVAAIMAVPVPDDLPDVA